MLADTVSLSRRVIQVTASILFCFTIAGLIFGFAALKPILLDSGVYADSCDVAPCKKQDTRLNFLFTVASSVTNVAALPMGALLDRTGPKIASIAGGLIFGLGCVVFGLGIVGPWVDTYLIGYALMALGSPLMFLAQFHLSNAFPQRSGLILGAITGAFDASSLPLVFYKIAYFANHSKPTLKTFFMGYTIIPILLIIFQLFLGPPEIYTRPSRLSEAVPIQPPTESTSLLPNRSNNYNLNNSAIAGDSTFSVRSRHSLSRPAIRVHRASSSFSRRSYAISEDAADEEIKLALEGKGENGIVGIMFGRSPWEQVKSSWWLAMLFMIMVHMINWYMATVQAQLVYYTSDEGLADKLTNAFIFLLPIGGIVSIPGIGWLLDNRPMNNIVLVMGTMGLAFGVLTILPYIATQLIGIAILTVFRPLFYTAISDYAAKVFGFETFGTVYGLGMTLSGLFGLILTPLDILVKGPLNGSYTALNIVLFIMGFIASMTLYGRTKYTPKIGLPTSAQVNEHSILEEDEDGN